jgi:hypothetical protein
MIPGIFNIVDMILGVKDFISDFLKVLKNRSVADLLTLSNDPKLKAS